jgi:hypothetical protein
MKIMNITLKNFRAFSFIMAMSLPFTVMGNDFAGDISDGADNTAINYQLCGKAICPKDLVHNMGATNYPVSLEQQCKSHMFNFPVRDLAPEFMYEEPMKLPGKIAVENYYGKSEITVFPDRFEIAGVAQGKDGKNYHFQSIHRLQIVSTLNAKGEKIPDMSLSTEIRRYSYSSHPTWGAILSFQLSNGVTLTYRESEMNTWAHPQVTIESKRGTDTNAEGSLAQFGEPELRNATCNTQRRGLVREITYEVQELHK